VRSNVSRNGKISQLYILMAGLMEFRSESSRFLSKKEIIFFMVGKKIEYSLKNLPVTVCPLEQY
jgi:hypothetical protein